ncbi:hypothetical protein DDB_G0268570 [Dictyostelium discoideum AX4]|uniref:FNIP repeat-containing protein n=1 Tax=Dictyostelium discoideum TaxID=44689 RepID=Q55FG4_DICDI|nr:hypothetical protein DDB_G0268570 [Dictyostelium discoideum AX4]EAL73738.1 hypothetical protein DDB_G0268570 [Dictyostelium discoideum AX4]|eukprot:XP_647569.1 hypothetical protein DDB_G0268570 [Dictyostelium discoideum AX4]
MEKYLFDWIKNSESDNKSNKLLDSILILSLNGLLISCEPLIELHNKFINNNNKNNNNIENSFYGLNSKQLILLGDQLKLLKKKNSNEKIIEKIKNNCGYNANKFNIIIENNLIYNLNNNNNLNDKINNCNNNNNKNNNNNNEIDLFFKIWRNKIIKKEILFQNRLFNIHSCQIKMTINQLLNYKYKEYLKSILITTNTTTNMNNDDGDGDEILEQKDEIISRGMIPNNIETLEFDYNLNPIIQENSLPNSIETLIFNKGFNRELMNLPNQLKTLEIGQSFTHTIKPGQLPPTLTNLNISKTFNGIIIPDGAIPKSVTSGNVFHKFDSFGNKYRINTDIRVPKNCTSLKFDRFFNQFLKVGDIPSNVQSIKFGYHFNNCLKENVLPTSLRTLKFGSCYNVAFDEYNKTLPEGLVNLEFSSYWNQDLKDCQIPSTLESISFGSTFDREIQGLSKSNLKSLKFHQLGFFDKPISIDQLPFKSLTSLSLGGSFNHPIKGWLNKLVNLIHLDLGTAFAQPIENNDLPMSVTSLRCLFQRQKILNNSILPPLKKMIFPFGNNGNNNNNYNYLDLSKLQLQSQSIPLLPNTLEILDIANCRVSFSYENLPPTLKIIYYSNSDIDYLNSIDDNLFTTYFKLYNN